MAWFTPLITLIAAPIAEAIGKKVIEILHETNAEEKEKNEESPPMKKEEK
jgi:hypothetical protein